VTEYRFSFDPAFEEDVDPFVGKPVNSRELAEKQMSLIAQYTLYLHEVDLMYDYSNLGFLEKRDPGGLWEVIEDEYR
jgi:hypothetical protein